MRRLTANFARVHTRLFGGGDAAASVTGVALLGHADAMDGAVQKSRLGGDAEFAAVCGDVP